MPYRGAVERYINGKIIGWVIKNDAIDDTLVVEARINGEVKSSSVANIQRDDLKNLGFASVAHGFIIDVGGIEGTKDMKVYISDTDHVIEELADNKTPTGETANMEDSRSNNTFQWKGNIDIIEQNFIVGWACDLSLPESSVTVEAVAKSGKKARAYASIHRLDVAAAGFGKGNHGFKIDISNFSVNDGEICVRFANHKETVIAQGILLDPISTLISGEYKPRLGEEMAFLVEKIHLKYTELTNANET